MIELFGYTLELWQVGAIAFGAMIAALLGTFGLTKLREKLAGEVQGYPYEKQIEELLIPLLDQAIIHAYKASETIADEIGQRLHGADKAAIAAGAYKLLPDTVQFLGQDFQWKEVVSEERFIAELEPRFEKAVALFDEASKYILDYVRPETHGMESPITLPVV